MNKWTLSALLVVTAGLAPHAWADDAGEGSQFLIQLNGAGPDSIAETINAAGGTLNHVVTDIGYVTAQSDDPEFAKNLRKANGIRSVTGDIRLHWVPGLRELKSSPADEFLVSAMGHIVDPNDAFFGDCQWNMEQINAQGAWADGYFGDPAVKVAVLDTGIDPFHVDLADNVDVAQSASMLVSPTICDEVFGPIDQSTFLDRNFHGTFVAALIAGQGNAVAGVAPHAGIVGVKVLDCLGNGFFSDIIAGIIYAANLPDVHVINMSLGTYLPRNLPAARGLAAAVNKAVNYANSKGKLVVSAAGNDFADLQHDRNWIFIPAESGAGIATWAGDIDGNLAPYSNHGVNAADLGAGGGTTNIVYPQVPLPGCTLPEWSHSAIVSACPTTSPFFPDCAPGNFVLFGSIGTSFSAPLVAGVAALLDGKYGGALNGGQLKEALNVTADDIGPKGADNEFGHGRVNADSASDL